MSLACLEGCDIPPMDDDKYMPRLSSMIKNRQIKDSVDMVDLLIDYMYGFDEFRNYSPVAAHYDGNKNGNYETLAVIDRVGRDTHNAWLYFPLDNVVYESTVNRTININNFSQTMHVADSIRGGGNTSRATWSRT